MATSSTLISLSLCFLFICHSSLGQYTFGAQSPWQSSRRSGAQGGCRFERLDALEPHQRVQSEAGYTEYFDESNQQLRCAGVAVKRRVVQPRGLVVPSYSNAPTLVYIIQGRGVGGLVFPGCPETYQSVQQQSGQFEEEAQTQGQRIRDEHQRVHRFRQGDVIALPAGVTHWCYNDGDVPVVAVYVTDFNNNANQLEPRHREFLLAGNFERGQQSYRLRQPFSEEHGQESYSQGYGRSGYNILNGFDPQLLAEALGVNVELARQLQSQNDPRGEIVYVERGLQVLRPSQTEEQQQQQQQEVYEGRRYDESRGYTGYEPHNGLDELFCTMRVRENIDDPSRADVFNPQGGRITFVNSQKLPILNHVQMSALRGVLHRNAMLTPAWTINAHSLIYVTQGRSRVQVVGSNGKSAFDGQLRQGQLLLVPQNYAVLKRALTEGYEWVSFKTNPNAMLSPIVGKHSTLRAMPIEVLMNSYRLSREQARQLKNSRREQSSIISSRTSRGFWSVANFVNGLLL